MLFELYLAELIISAAIVRRRSLPIVIRPRFQFLLRLLILVVFFGFFRFFRQADCCPIWLNLLGKINFRRTIAAEIIDFAKEIEPYWAAIRIQEESEEAEEAEEYDEDEEPEEESEPWTDFYEKSAPAEKPTSGGYYQFSRTVEVHTPI